MPKAAFQFGVKTSDGRRNKKQMDKDQKINNELNQITKIIDRRKRERGGGDKGDEEFRPTMNEKKRNRL